MPVENGARQTGQTQAEESGGSEAGRVGTPGEKGEGTGDPMSLQQQPADEVAAGKEDQNNGGPMMNGKFPNTTDNVESQKDKKVSWKFLFILTGGRDGCSRGSFLGDCKTSLISFER